MGLPELEATDPPTLKELTDHYIIIILCIMLLLYYCYVLYYILCFFMFSMFLRADYVTVYPDLSHQMWILFFEPARKDHDLHRQTRCEPASLCGPERGEPRPVISMEYDQSIVKGS